MAVAGAVRIAHFTEMSRASVEGPYDLSLVEGSITTESDADRIQDIRRSSRRLVTIGACATAGGIQALRNSAEDGAYVGTVYAHPEYISSLSTSTPISAHVPVDLELQGCPIDRRQLLDVITAELAGRDQPSRATRCARSARAAASPACPSAGDRLPRSGDPSGLRCSVPLGGPRLLRVLRPLRGRQPQGPGRRLLAKVWRRSMPPGSSPPSTWATRCSATKPRVWPGRERPDRTTRRNRMTHGSGPHRTVAVGGLSRVEGEGSLRVEVRDGVVADVALAIFEPPRFFEAMLRGGEPARRPTSRRGSAGSARWPTR